MAGNSRPAFEALQDAVPALDRLIGDAPGPDDRNLLLAGRFVLVLTGLDDATTSATAITLAREMEVPPGDTIAERQLLGIQAMAGALAGKSAVTVRERARLARRIRSDPAGELSTLGAAFALLLTDDLDESLAALDWLVDGNQHEDTGWTLSLALSTRAAAMCVAGDFDRAYADAGTAVTIAASAAWDAPMVLPRVMLAKTLCHRGELHRAEALLETARRPRHDELVWQYPVYLMVRAVIQRRRRDLDGALRWLTLCGEHLARSGVENPVFAPWWLEASELLAAAGRADEAAPFVEHGMRTARAWGTRRASGLSLLARGLTTPGRPGILLLEEAVATLESSVAGDEHRRALYSLARALMVDGDLRAARARLGQLTDLADQAGDPIVGGAAHRLLTAARGKQPGAPGLTAGEQRVVQLVAAGRTNREVAAELFVSIRTVEARLTSVYRKLGVGGRADLVTLRQQTGEQR
ncbi:helix-turn-helix transcriptional regulator [Paractinoplanes brasiliensis]|uniref:Regulatory LuxR family protein n=2 Tax=Paractinoplanes brasiliensis TaxID=52695 RepID=A0A4R6JBV5_9ACTN|nr:helix-turn-helix transcriptional regulator [Actinoplanes brasiliensis]TDO33199.1 regulatory LuxR family protein [Actinoplanes brasiliensis]